MLMDSVEFHCEPPSNVSTMVVAFGGWIDAGEAGTGAMRALVRQLAATPLAAIDPEDFFDFTQVRPVVRLSAEGQRIIRWPRSAFWTWQPPAGRAGLLLFRGMEPQRRWRTYATRLLDVAAGCSGSCRWARSSRPCPIPAPHTSRATAPTPPGTRGWRRAGCRGARATKARPALPRSSWRRRRAVVSPRSPCEGKRPITSGAQPIRP